MKNDFETKFTGWALIIGALMLIVGWVLLPYHTGEYLKVSDFSAINENFWTWIWLYRLHIFGWVAMGGGIVGIAAITFKAPLRIMTTSGSGILIVGTFVSALATAFYYSFGAWGIGMTMDKSPEEIQQFMDGILPVTHYITCLARFGKVFSGAGLVILGAGFLKFNITDKWLSLFTILLGLTAMGTVMLIHDNYEIYKPIFYVKVVWLIALGATILRKGINLSEAS